MILIIYYKEERGLKNSWKDNSYNFNLLLTYINRYNHEPPNYYPNELKISILKDAKRIIKLKSISGLCLALKASFQCQPKFYYHNGIKEIPNLSTALQYYFQSLIRIDLLRIVLIIMVTGGILMIKLQEWRYYLH